jgi:hypothetical protein
MNLAPEICGKCVANYTRTRDIPDYFQINATAFNKFKKSVNNPITTYHKWLETDEKEISRASIINELNQRNTNKKTLNSEPKKLHKRIVGDVAEVAINPDVEVDDGVNADADFDFDPSITSLLKLNHSKQESKVFNLLINMYWCDTDVKFMSATRIKPIKIKLLELLPTMFIMADNLFCAINSTTGLLDELVEESRYDFLFHIIFKGEQFYSNCISDPGFCTYLIPDGYQKTMRYILDIYGHSNIADLRC